MRDSPFASLLLDEEPDDDDAKSPSHVGAICIRIAQKFNLLKVQVESLFPNTSFFLISALSCPMDI